MIFAFPVTWIRDKIDLGELSQVPLQSTFPAGSRSCQNRDESTCRFTGSKPALSFDGIANTVRGVLGKEVDCRQGGRQNVMIIVGIKRMTHGQRISRNMPYRSCAELLLSPSSEAHLIHVTRLAIASPSMISSSGPPCHHLNSR